jgi:cobalt/nickel transport system permease protein
MHIPDGFIDAKTAAVTAALSAIGVGLALRRVKRELPPRRVPLLGLAAAFLFAAQMVNFPVAGGTSGHLIGGVLVAALLGPSAAVVVVTTVLIVQCFLFADGGVLALGANIFNMGIIGGAGGWAIYRVLCGWLPGARGRVTAIAFAGWASTVLASICCAGQLAWSGTVAWPAAFTAMAGVHILIGIGEGLISALAFLAIERTRPEVITEMTTDSPRWGERTREPIEAPGRLAGTLAPPGAISSKPTGYAELVGYGLLIAIGVAVFVAPFACPWPDGLEAVAAKLGFEHRATPPLLSAPAPDYQIPGIHWAVGATAIAGAAGSLVVFGLALLLGRWLVPKQAVNVCSSRGNEAHFKSEIRNPK